MSKPRPAPDSYPPLEMPEGVERTKITVWSLGLALDADLYRPKGLSSEDQRPGVVLCHGIGGDKLTAERYAGSFAAAGMICVSFSQSSWGDSHGRMTLLDEEAAPDQSGEMTVRVRMARQLMDPLEWVDCFRSVIDWLEGEPNLDPNRIGAWGTSFGGGTALYVASIDARVRALSVQVPALFNVAPSMEALGASRATQIARGETPPIPFGPPDYLPNLVGTPHFPRLAQYRVGDRVQHVKVPTLIIDAGEEEMFDISESGARAHSILSDLGNSVRYEVVPGISHYGIYFEGFEFSRELSQQWFLEHL